MLEKLSDEQRGKAAEDPILYRKGRLYRVIDEAALKDFQQSGVLRPNPNPETSSGKPYERLFASEGSTGARYRGRYVVEIDP